MKFFLAFKLWGEKKKKKDLFFSLYSSYSDFRVMLVRVTISH